MTQMKIDKIFIIETGYKCCSNCENPLNITYIGMGHHRVRCETCDKRIEYDDYDNIKFIEFVKIKKKDFEEIKSMLK